MFSLNVIVGVENEIFKFTHVVEMAVISTKRKASMAQEFVETNYTVSSPGGKE